MEANDLNDWLNRYIKSTTGEDSSRLKFRTASFCMERSGHFDAFDQGISFFLPNMTWLQPPGHVHAMIKDTWQPNNLDSVQLAGATSGQSASAQRSADGKTVV